MDAHRAHLNDVICRRARALNIFLLYIPAKLTWLLQPADTHLFAPFKASVRRKYTNERLTTSDARVDREQWLSIVCEALLDSVRDQTWTRAFQSNGIINQQQDTSLYVRSFSGLSRATYPIVQPSRAELEYLFGMQNIPYNLLLPEQPPVPPVRHLGEGYIIPRARRLLSPGEGTAPDIGPPAPSPPDSAHGGGDPSASSGSGGRGSRGRGSGKGGSGRGRAQHS